MLKHFLVPSLKLISHGVNMNEGLSNIGNWFSKNVDAAYGIIPTHADVKMGRIIGEGLELLVDVFSNIAVNS